MTAAEIERLTVENKRLRAIVVGCLKVCPWGEKSMATCSSGFPGCACADEIAVGEEALVDELRHLRSELARKDEALQFVQTLLRWPRAIYTGISSEAIVAYAIGGDMPLRDSEYPRDESDLERCENVRRAAPAGLHERMDEVLVLYRAALGKQV